MSGKSLDKIKKWDMILLEASNYKVIVGLASSDARPHLILLFHGKNRSYKMNIYDILGNATLYSELLDMIGTAFKKYKGVIFSLHLGCYQSRDSPHFHAHLVLPIDRYMKIVNRFLKPPVAPEYWSNLEMWSNKIIIEGKKYQRNDLINISKINNISNPPTTNTQYDIIFHTNQPRIGFKLSCNYTDATLLKIMLEYAKEHGLDDRKKGGCHICLQDDFYVDNEFSNIRGYIQMDPVNYYQLHPDQKVWLDSYRKTTYFVVT